MCVWVVCVAYIIIRSNQKMQSQLCTLYSRWLVLFFCLFAKSLSEMLTDFRFGSRFISAPELDPHLPPLIDSHHLSDTSGALRPHYSVSVFPPRLEHRECKHKHSPLGGGAEGGAFGSLWEPTETPPAFSQDDCTTCTPTHKHGAVQFIKLLIRDAF